MGKVVIKDDCLAPSKFIYMYYDGPNPLKVARGLSGIFNSYFQVTSSKWCEEKFKWDTTSDPRDFYIKWWVNKPVSAHTTLRFKFYVQGTHHSATGKGRFTLEVTASAEHKFSTNWFMQGFFWIYRYVFYDRLRARFINECRKYCLGFREYVKKEFNIQPLKADFERQQIE